MSEENILVIISADTEWKIVCTLLKPESTHDSPYGHYFEIVVPVKNKEKYVIFFHGGWGKVSAAASTQYSINRFNPVLLINLGTCGGFKGFNEKNKIILVEKAIIYDIIEQMGNPAEHITHYATCIDLSWLDEKHPREVIRTMIVSGDRDLRAEDIQHLHTTYGAIVGDWESGAIAWVAKRNNKKLLILRGVTDLVGVAGGEAYKGNMKVYETNAYTILKQLIDALPHWISAAKV